MHCYTTIILDTIKSLCCVYAPGAQASCLQSGNNAGKMPALPGKDKTPKGWHSRGYLPHFDAGEVPQAIMFRLANSLPRERLDSWKQELRFLPTGKAEVELRRRIEAYLDAVQGEAWLADQRIAMLVENALLYSDGKRYYLHGWVVMPNHVHTLITPQEGFRLSDIVHSWKSFTAREANLILDRSGSFWQTEYFDRYIRNERHFAAALNYIEDNPVKAGLCNRREEWRYSSAVR